MLVEVTYEWIPGRWAQDELIEECAALYSANYGRWSEQAPHSPGARVRLSSARLKAWTQSEDSRVICARLESILIGYAIAVQTKMPRYGVVSWVTQFVVDERYQNQRVGTNLLFAIWGFTDHFAWGIVTANPYAVRALEKATRRRCSPPRIARHAPQLLELGSRHVPYINAGNMTLLDRDHASVDTQFPLDHSTVNDRIKRASSSAPWELGDLRQGWEWFAFTFHDQAQISLTSQEIDTMIAASDKVTRLAYSRMALTDDQVWTRHTNEEVEQILRLFPTGPSLRIIDFGCGTGRHSLALAERGVRVVGVDYVSSFVAAAKKEAERLKLPNAQFIEGDCRSIEIEPNADAVICLYDVIGTYADNDENRRIVMNIFRHLKSGGFALISVMNRELTERKATNWFSLHSEPDALLALQPSRTMERTGNVFDPDFYMVDRESHVVYRKEQFQQGSAVPVELIVRDRRFYRREIEEMCAQAGLAVIWSRHVRSGDWDNDLAPDDDRAKEVLVLCQRQG